MEPKNYDLDVGSSPLKVDEFIGYINAQDYSPATRRAYMDSILDYERHGFRWVSLEAEQDYRDKLVAEGKKGNTVNLRLNALNVYNRWAGLPPIPQIRVNEDPFAVNGMELEDYHKLIDGLLHDGKYNWYVIVKLLASTGMRIGEARKVTFGDLRRGSCQVYGKGGKPRTVFFTHTLQESLWFYTKDKLNEELIIPYSPGYIRSFLLRSKKRYGLTCALHPHEFRHLFARQMYDATHDEALIKGLLGHENLKTTSRYIKKTQREGLKLYARAQNW